MKTLTGVTRVILVAAVVCLTAACSGGNNPKAVAENYAAAIIKGDYKAAFDYVYFGDDKEEAQQKKEQILALVEEKVKNGVPDKSRMEKFTIVEEQIDEENGTATMTAMVTYGNGENRTEKISLLKNDEGKWMIDNAK